MSAQYAFYQMPGYYRYVDLRVEMRTIKKKKNDYRGNARSTTGQVKINTTSAKLSPYRSATQHTSLVHRFIFRLDSFPPKRGYLSTDDEIIGYRIILVLRPRDVYNFPVLAIFNLVISSTKWKTIRPTCSTVNPCRCS